MAGYLDASGLEHFKRKNDAAYLGKREKAASAAVADSVDWKNVSGRPDLSAGIPPGTIIHYAGRTVPSGWLICNGADVSRTDYAALFAAIGTIYGAGNGSTTFGLPNLNGRFFEGTTYTGSVGTYHSAGLPNISGEYQGGDGLNLYSSGAFGFVKESSSQIRGSGFNLDIGDFKASRSSSVFGSSRGVQPPSMELLPCIKF